MRVTFLALVSAVKGVEDACMSSCPTCEVTQSTGEETGLSCRSVSDWV